MFFQASENEKKKFLFENKNHKLKVNLKKKTKKRFSMGIGNQF